ncbi:uncharacterized [Tachysurus ichikawai]
MLRLLGFLPNSLSFQRKQAELAVGGPGLVISDVNTKEPFSVDACVRVAEILGAMVVSVVLVHGPIPAHGGQCE